MSHDCIHQDAVIWIRTNRQRYDWLLMACKASTHSSPAASRVQFFVFFPGLCQRSQKSDGLTQSTGAACQVNNRLVK